MAGALKRQNFARFRTCSDEVLLLTFKLPLSESLASVRLGTLSSTQADGMRARVETCRDRLVWKYRYASEAAAFGMPAWHLGYASNGQGRSIT